MFNEYIPSPASLQSLTLVSWNLLHEQGATIEDIILLIRITKPDIVLLQEVKFGVDQLPGLIGGYYHRSVLPGRPHGTACWSRIPFETPTLLPLQPGICALRSAQILTFETGFGMFSIANVHLSHGPMLNRRQLRLIRSHLTERAIIIGDFNIVGPPLLKGFRDIGPREKTHLMLNRIPLRLDRCLARGFRRLKARALPRLSSDHRPITLTLEPETLPVTDKA
ncbi:endonuclease/exonuclease/phosphatase family protein [Aristophania vespae]|uniref:Endonuclease/exonuclease/phosphatase family protein n=1 Tax=Aristophania vespae TaxID=2697033 RepID=A0A6P1NA02_9PROT|nr:endonuclease/exonuclease/phosphatase family protein [Aristophania vespae]QHI95435.1 endonuclease/exonuclease/phosphatase family protein [Aristophania vespae]